MSGRKWHRSSAALLLMGLLANGSQAQEVRGRVVIEGSRGQPVEGARVALLTPRDTTVDAAFTTTGGFFQLDAPLPGQYRVKIERIGFENWTSEAISLVAGELRSVEFAIPIWPVRLTELDVRIRRQCIDDPRAAEQLFTVWDEARKALEAALLAQSENLLRFNSITFDRIRSLRSLELIEVTTTTADDTRETPFKSRPAEELSQVGYIQEEGERIYFYAPDAKVLLSDMFLADHCFGLEREDVDGRKLVGLTFDPHEDRQVPDIKGVLWLDEESAELDHVEFEYRRIPYRGVEDDRIGGRIDFRRLPTGAFVVDAWFIRMPILEQTERDRRHSRYRIVRFTEHGGELRDVFSSSGEPVGWLRRVSIHGAVVDPLTGEPLRDATLTLQRPRGPSIVRHTGPNGEFLYDDLRPGEHNLELFHPTLLIIGVERPSQELQLVEGDSVTVSFALPAVAEIIDHHCPQGTDGGLLLGRVTDAETGFPRRNVAVWAEWNERTGAEPSGAPPAGSRRKIGEVRTDRAGRYALCGVPLQETIDVYMAGLIDIESRRARVSRPVVILNFEVRYALTGPSSEHA